MRITLNRRGFTVIESIMGLLMLSLIAMLINTTTLYINNSDRHQRSEIINYHVFLSTIESRKLNLRVVKTDDNNITLINPSNYKEYRIQTYKNMLRLSGNKSGHVPILENVASTYFSIHKNHLFIKLTFINHQEFESETSIEKN
ncbi:prepilin-type N-terminal cleavage/methylation domain-containing protein [Apilactobacillus timberlakei]|uniref:Prepilin-type N-terminal cleavage/methylation domain-containing protein n=1 Tax=Apilactobacillus timberlakei TaxID=2008380 RepID=A0ABY2YSE7_9LACO|nr:prepilin-type N-terminal cleavage/methylation domain-containing protein [Apilactobacillus timberlakei]TPR13557.1 prepilin-type N-terminal cleavage/methylation domain-containing protein [Apilactobacillus timberlakei]TPR15630.1 prepilin-type N-terminal cleavage/methylation domain-containing protein [Apilactobacillus timberlakei]TPR17878.1 prepilin-type N-terminal cleavage/methylation domain-containing protein [Apilactobacillus timberlakei]TPR22823.1 prepilin-type N-terminal cleavage/methylatio